MCVCGEQKDIIFLIKYKTTTKNDDDDFGQNQTHTHKSFRRYEEIIVVRYYFSNITIYLNCELHSNVYSVRFFSVVVVVVV